MGFVCSKCKQEREGERKCFSFLTDDGVLVIGLFVSLKAYNLSFSGDLGEKEERKYKKTNGSLEETSKSEGRRKFEMKEECVFKFLSGKY